MMPALDTVNPVGRPATLNVSDAPSGSTPDSDRLNGWPIGLDWSPGLASVGAVLVTPEAAVAQTSADSGPSSGPDAYAETAKQYPAPGVATSAYWVARPTSRRWV